MLKWIVSLMVIVSSFVFAEMITIDSIKKIGLHVDGKENVLLVFDIDDTLTILSDPVFHRPNFKIHHAKTFEQVMSTLSPKQKMLAFTMPLIDTPSDLIELDAPEFFQDLRIKKIKTIALTAAMGGKIQDISIEDRRIAELKRVGIDFSYSFPEVLEVEFPDFKSPLLGRNPLFKDGVLLTNENDKGEVLIAFLKSIAWKPDLILFIDDRIEHLHAVSRAIQAYFPEIKFQGFHYTNKNAPYSSTEVENFIQKWTILAEKAKKLLPEE